MQATRARYVLPALLLLLAIILSGCTSTNSTTDWRGSDYFYDFEACPWNDGFMDIVEQTAAFNVLPWEQFRNAAYAHGFGKNTYAFQQGWAIWLQVGYTLNALFHEIGHIHDWLNGRTGHNSECWGTFRPWGYDEIVREALGDFRP